MAKKDIYRLDLVVGVKGDGETKVKLKATEKFAQQTEKRMKRLNKIKVSPSVRVVDKASSTLAKISRKSARLNRVITSTARVIDKASPMINKIRSKATIFDRPINTIINAKDKTSEAVNKVKAKIQNLAAATIISLNMRADPALRAIALTRNKLSELSSKMSAFGGKTYQAIVNIKDNVSPKLQSIDGKINSFIKNVVTKFGAIATAGAVAFGGLGAGASIKGFAEFEQGMKNVQAVSGATTTQMQQLTDKAREMGRVTAFTSTDAASALEYMGMAGWKTTDMISGLPGILNLAAAGSVDLGVASDIVTDGLTAMGLTAKDTDKYVDIMAATITNSNTSVELMGETMKYVGSVGGALGVEMSDLSLAIGLMGNASIKGSQAGTALRGGLTRLIKPPKEAANALKKYGIEIKKTGKGSLDLAGTMNELRTKLSGLDATTQGSALAMIFGQEAMAGWAAIVNASEQDFNKLSNAIENSSGKAKDVADIKLDSLSGQFELLKSAVDDVKLSLGERLAPYTKDFVKWLTSKMPEIGDSVVKVVDKVTTSIPKITNVLKDLLPVISGLIASFLVFKVMMTGMSIITTIVPIISNVISAIALFAGGAGTLAEAMLLIMGPIGWITLGIGLLVGAFVLAYQKSEVFRNKVNELGQQIMGFLGPVITFIKDKLMELGSKFMELIGQLSPLGSALLELGIVIINALSPIITFVASVFVTGLMIAFSAVVNVISGAVGAISTILGGLTSIISGLTNFVVGVFTGSWSQAFQGAQSIVSGAVSIISGLWQGLVSLLTAPIQALVDILDSAFKEKASGIKKIWSDIKSFLSNPIQGVVNIVKSITGGGKSEKKPKTKHATGGIFTTPHVALFAEEPGGEAIIPLNGKRRDRAISLWKETGEKLGMVNKDRYRNAGNQSSYFTTGDRSRFEPKESNEDGIPTRDGGSSGGPTFPVYTPKPSTSPSSIDVNVEVNNNFDSELDNESIVKEVVVEVGKELKYALDNIR